MCGKIRLFKDKQILHILFKKNCIPPAFWASVSVHHAENILIIVAWRAKLSTGLFPTTFVSTLGPPSLPILKFVLHVAHVKFVWRAACGQNCRVTVWLHWQQRHHAYYHWEKWAGRSDRASDFWRNPHLAFVEVDWLGARAKSKASRSFAISVESTLSLALYFKWGWERARARAKAREGGGQRQNVCSRGSGHNWDSTTDTVNASLMPQGRFLEDHAGNPGRLANLWIPFWSWETGSRSEDACEWGTHTEGMWWRSSLCSSDINQGAHKDNRCRLARHIERWGLSRMYFLLFGKRPASERESAHARERLPFPFNYFAGAGEQKQGKRIISLQTPCFFGFEICLHFVVCRQHQSIIHIRIYLSICMYM